MTEPDCANIEKSPVVETVKKTTTRKKYLPGRGAQLAVTLMDAGLVDQYRLTVALHIIGTGKSFFAHLHHRSKLTRTAKVPSGTMILIPFKDSKPHI